MATSSTTAFTAPSIAGQALKRQLSPVIIKNVVQGLYHQNGRGINQSVVLDTNAMEIRVVREKPLTQKSRSLGATVDGDFFSSQTAEQPTSDEYGVRITLAYDTPIDIPSNMTDMFPLDLVNATIRNYHQAVSKNINASTIATQLAALFNYDFANTTDNTIEYDSSSDELLDIYFDASIKLDDGDATNGVDTFPEDSRIALWRSSGKKDFYKTAKSVFEIGNWKAQDMMKLGSVDWESTPNTVTNGFFGTINQTYNFMVASAVWTLAVKYMRMSDTFLPATALDTVVGYMCASMGTLRGIAMQSTLKTVDSQAGQGIRLQPKQRWGIETIYPLSIVPIVNTSYTNPATAAISIIGVASNTDQS